MVSYLIFFARLYVNFNSLFSSVMTVCVYLFFPETKGKSLEEMDEVFKGSVWAFKKRTPIIFDGPTNEKMEDTKDIA